MISVSTWMSPIESSDFGWKNLVVSVKTDCGPSHERIHGNSSLAKGEGIGSRFGQEGLFPLSNCGAGDLVQGNAVDAGGASDVIPGLEAAAALLAVCYGKKSLRLVMLYSGLPLLVKSCRSPLV